MKVVKLLIASLLAIATVCFVGGCVPNQSGQEKYGYEQGGDSVPLGEGKIHSEEHEAEKTEAH